MRLYGQRKIKGRVDGHGHECWICKPPIEKKTGRRKAREEGKRREVEDTNKDPLPIFMMDGTEHFRESETRCCGSFGKKCECGGFMHYQPVFGGYYYKCEDCLKEEYK